MLDIKLEFILMIVFLFLKHNLLSYLIFIIFILIHELMHLIYGFFIGGKLEKISITIFGLKLKISFSNNVKQFNRILFYFIGPFSNLLIFTVLKLKSNSEMSIYMQSVNMVLFIFNVFPILPLDGGNIIKELFAFYFDNDKCYLYTLEISKIFLAIISFVYSIMIIKIKSIYILFLLIYLWGLYFKELNTYNDYLNKKKIIIDTINMT